MVRRLLLSIAASILFTASLSAQEPVEWKCSVKNIKADTFEVHIHALIGDGWHIFSLEPSEGVIGKPTEIHFNNNPLVELKGKLKEIGDVEKYKQDEYHKGVDFIQTIVLKRKLKTTLNGTISFQTCTEHECVFPDPLPFSISIN
jgi:hypothetical protein